MVNALCPTAAHADRMTDQEVDETWARIRDEIAKRDDGRGRETVWLAQRLQVRIQRIQNWKTRGVPSSALVDIAAALGWSVNQVLGLADPPTRWPFETIRPDDMAKLTPRQAAMVEIAVVRELERIAASGKPQDKAA